ncbi:MAG: hypothetical protein ACOYMP_14790 [Nodosilinea sp.]
MHINLPGIPNIATGSACTSGTEAPSHVLRLSLGKFCSDNDLHPTATLLHQAVQAIHSLTTEVP